MTIRQGAALDAGALLKQRGVGTEKQLMQTIVAYAKARGWLCSHTFDSRRSEPGWPDLVLLRGDRLLFIECKTERGVLSRAQATWIRALQRTGCIATVWRPSDWRDGTIERILD